jgi:hypothetical protein
MPRSKPATAIRWSIIGPVNNPLTNYVCYTRKGAIEAWDKDHSPNPVNPSKWAWRGRWRKNRGYRTAKVRITEMR